VTGNNPVVLEVLASGLDFPEGPLFDASGNLWCVEMKAGRLACLDTHGGLHRYSVGGAPNGLAHDAAGGIWFCDADRNAVRRLEPRSDTCGTIVDRIGGRPLDRPNDLAFDAAGNLLFTCPGDSRIEPSGYVCCLAANGTCTVIAEGFCFPNGLALTAAGDLIVAETRRQRLWRGRWDTGRRRWTDPCVLCTTAGAPIGPDGLAVDQEGRIYAAIYGAGMVEVFAANGLRLEAIATAGANPSNCAFDPSGRLGLVITETERGEILNWPTPARGMTLPIGGWPRPLSRTHP
jgi:gluconolactonase